MGETLGFDAWTYPQVLQRRVEPLAVLAQALLAVLNVAVDLDHLGLEHVPVRLKAGEHVDKVGLRLCRSGAGARELSGQRTPRPTECAHPPWFDFHWSMRRFGRGACGNVDFFERGHIKKSGSDGIGAM